MAAELAQELYPLLNTHFIRPLCQRLQEASGLLSRMAAPPTANLTEPLALLRLVQQQTPELPAPLPAPVPLFKQQFSVLIPALETWLSGKPPVVEEEQHEDRFKLLATDALPTKLGKAGKITAYTLARLPTQVGNRFRKEARPPRRWQHQIPWRNLLRQYVLVHLLRQLQPLLQSAEQLQQQLLLAARDASEQAHRRYTEGNKEYLTPEEEEKVQLEREHLLQKSQELQRYIEGQGRIILSQLAEEIQEAYPKAGTLELPAQEFAPWRTERLHKQQLGELNHLWQEWQYAHQALISQWQLRMALYTTLYTWQLETQQMREAIGQGLSAEFWPAFEEITHVLTGLKDKLTRQKLAVAIPEARQVVREKLQAERLRNVVAGLISQDLAGRVQRLEQALAQATNVLPELTTVAKTGQLAEPLRQSELAAIRPQKLVKLELLPKAESQLVELKVSIIQAVEEARARLLEMEDVCHFNLESALAYLQDHPDEELKAQAIAFEGLDRTINQIQQVENRLRSLEANVPKEVEGTLAQLYQQLLNLRKADNLWSLELRLLRARALQQSGNFADRLEQRFGGKLPQVIKQLETGLRWTRQQQTQLRSRLGLEAAPPSIATEVTDFLQENEEAQQQLPFVYRRLYNTEPLQEELFFVGRKAELSSLMTTYTRWQAGRYASLLITGEKGSGLSSLLNIFQKQLPAEQAVVRIELPQHPATSQPLYDAVTQAFTLPPVNSFAQLVNALRNLPEPGLVIVEDIQRLVLRRLGGFGPLKEFLALVAATNRKFCWVASCSVYAWQYADRALQAADSWAQIMPMQTFSREQLLALIMQRHRVSGYQLIFQPSEQDIHSKKFAAMEAGKQQRYLQDKFFQKLAAFSQSNLRLALLYWLRSTLSVSKNTITLSTTLNPEFGFLANLSPEKYFGLRQLLLHDYLTTELFADLQHISTGAAKYQLQALYDVGLLIQRPEMGYSLNPLLYRQIVNVLKHRNLIH